MARFAVDVVFTYEATFLVEADSHHNAKAIQTLLPNVSTTSLGLCPSRSTSQCQSYSEAAPLRCAVLLKVSPRRSR
jgi:hypothetical protein